MNYASMIPFCKFSKFSDLICTNLVSLLTKLLFFAKTKALCGSNILLNERPKYNHYAGNPPEIYFWRTYVQQEIDLVEIRNRQITAFI